VDKESKQCGDRELTKMVFQSEVMDYKKVARMGKTSVLHLIQNAEQRRWDKERAIRKNGWLPHVEVESIKTSIRL
jgi:hypothetical protein